MVISFSLICFVTAYAHRPEDLRIPFERFGPLKDVYLPKNYYTGYGVIFVFWFAMQSTALICAIIHYFSFLEFFIYDRRFLPCHYNISYE